MSEWRCSICYVALDMDDVGEHMLNTHSLEKGHYLEESVNSEHQHGPYIVTEWLTPEKTWNESRGYHAKVSRATRVRCANCLEEKEL